MAGQDAFIAATLAERADSALLKAWLTTVLLEIERIKLQLAMLRRQPLGQSSERLDHDSAGQTTLTPFELLWSDNV